MEPMAIADHRPRLRLLHLHDFGEEFIFGNHMVVINDFRIVSIRHWGRIEPRALSQRGPNRRSADRSWRWKRSASGCKYTLGRTGAVVDWRSDAGSSETPPCNEHGGRPESEHGDIRTAWDPTSRCRRRSPGPTKYTLQCSLFT